MAITERTSETILTNKKGKDDAEERSTMLNEEH